MASDDKKIKTDPAAKNEVPSKSKSTSGVDTSKAEAARLLTPHRPVTAEARARNRFLRLIRITGTRSSQRKRSDNSAAFWRHH